MSEKVIRKNKSNPTMKGKGIFLFALLIIPIINFLVFWVYVNFQSILNAFRIEVYEDVIFSFSNWKFLLDDLLGRNLYPIFPTLLKNTLKFFSMGLFIILPLSLFLSYFLYKKIRFYKYYRIIFFLPNIISAAVLATLYKFMMNPSLGGVITKIYELIMKMPAKNFLTQDETAMTAVMIYSVWTGFSVNLIIFNGAMSRVPLEVVEAAKIDGVTMFQEFIYIIFPMIWSTLSTIIVINVANIFTSSGAILLLTGGDYDTSTISFWIYITTRNQLSIYYPSTVALACTVVALPIVLLTKKLTSLIYKDITY